jgi:hypothetical protein
VKKKGDISTSALYKSYLYSGRIHVPQPSFGEPWSHLTIFGTSTGWLKTKCQAKWRSRDLAPFCELFGFRVYVTSMGCRPMGLPMFRPICNV